MPQAETTVVANMRRSATKNVMFAFLINPILCSSTFWYHVLRRITTREEYPEAIFWAAFAYMMVSFAILPYTVFYEEVKRLKRLGFTLQPDRFPRRQLDWGIILAVCAAGYWSCTKRERKSAGEEDMQTYISAALMFLSAWVGLIMITLGRIWYFAAETPTPAAQQVDRLQM